MWAPKLSHQETDHVYITRFFRIGGTRFRGMTNEIEAFPHFCPICERQLETCEKLYCSEECRLIDADTCSKCEHHDEEASSEKCEKCKFSYSSIFHCNLPPLECSHSELELPTSDEESNVAFSSISKLLQQSISLEGS